MPLTGNPPEYTRGYDYEQHSIDQPNVPQPGDKLNQDFDDIATAVNATNGALQDILNPDGTLKDGIVGEAQLDPAVYDQLVDDATADLQPMVDQAQQGAATATAKAAQAKASAQAADQYAQNAQGAVTDATQAMANVRMYAGQAEQAAEDAAVSEANAANSANTAQGAMSNALKHQDKAFQWAEYLAGPVDPAPPGWPEAVDDGLWSAKWWAVRAREIVGAWGSLYLGAFPTPPVPDPGNQWPPGELYYDTTKGMMMVWNGAQWVPVTAPGPSVASSFVYLATADQTDFTGPDANGNTPILNAGSRIPPSDVHVNGVRLVQDDGFGLGDYTVDPNTNTLTILVPLTENSIVQWDLLLTPADLAPGSVIAHKLFDVDKDPTTNAPGEFDGVTTEFPLYYISSVDGTTNPCAPGTGVQLQVSLDGVMQEFGEDFTTTGANLVFSEAPPPTTKFWGVWYQPGQPPA